MYPANVGTNIYFFLDLSNIFISEKEKLFGAASKNLRISINLKTLKQRYTSITMWYITHTQINSHLCAELLFGQKSNANKIRHSKWCQISKLFAQQEQ